MVMVEEGVSIPSNHGRSAASSTGVAIFELDQVLQSSSTSTSSSPQPVWHNAMWNGSRKGDSSYSSTTPSSAGDASGDTTPTMAQTAPALKRLKSHHHIRAPEEELKELWRQLRRKIDSLEVLEVPLRSGKVARARVLFEEGIVVVNVGESRAVAEKPSSTVTLATPALAKLSISPQKDVAENEHNTSYFTSHIPRALPPNLAWFGDAFAKTILGPMILAFPWHSTSIGPISSWPTVLLHTISTMLASPFREYLTFGPDFLIMYNDEYIGAAGSKHPRLLGQPFFEGFAEARELLEPPMQSAMQGATHSFTSNEVPLVRDGFLQETYHHYSYSPVRDETGTIRGLVNRSFETTLEVIAERRTATVRDLVQKTALAHSVAEFCETAMDCCDDNPWDLPFVMLFTVEVVEIKSERKKMSTALFPSELVETRTFAKMTLRGSAGLPETHPFFVRESNIEINRSRSSSRSASSRNDTPPGYLWPFEEGFSTHQPVSVNGKDFELLASALVGKAWGDYPREARVVPVATDSAGDGVPAAFLVIGLNPRVEYNERYSSFVQIVSRHIGIGLVAVQNSEADARREAELLALDKAKTSFFANTSHELRTPLTLVLGPLEDVLNEGGYLPPDVRTRLDMCARNANRLLTMVNKLLDFSALEAGRKDLLFQPVHLGEFTSDLASMFRDAIERSGLAFSVEVGAEPPHCLPTYLSRDLYSHVIFNLLGNALKYTPAGEVKVVVRHTVAEAVVEIIDTGIGIPEDELERVFDRFHRIERSADTTTGTGIGLALTLEMVRTQGGELSVDSTVQEGSNFTIRFPRGFTHLPSDRLSHAYDATASSSPGSAARKALQTEIKDATFYRETAFADPARPVPILPSPAVSSSGRSSQTHPSGNSDYFGDIDLLNVAGSTIVLADDNHDLRSYTAGLLRRSYNVIEFADGESARVFCLATPPDLVISDLMMPRLTGNGLLDALQANPSTSALPVIFISAAAGPEARSTALEAGAIDYIVKPFASREMLARVKVAIVTSKMRHQLSAQVQSRTEELNASEERYKALAKKYETVSRVSPVGLFMLDSSLNVVYTNPRWHQITGTAPTRDLDEWKEAVHPDDHAQLLSALSEAAAGRCGGTVQLRWADKWAQLELRNVTDFGSDVFLAGTLTDISAQRRLEAFQMETAEQRVRDAEENRRHIESFIDIASHEIRNPLSGVWQNASMINESLRDAVTTISSLRTEFPTRATLKALENDMNENLEGISAILICAAHQNRIADDILNVSKLNMGLLTVTRAPFDMVEKMREVLRMFDADCSSKAINLLFDCGASVEALDATWISADASRLAQAATNFLLNAIRFTPRGGSITARLQASATPPIVPEAPGEGVLRVGQTDPEDTSGYTSPVWVTCAVEDTGKGLTSDEMHRLFERFSQVNPKSDQYGGSGLGLFVSKKLIELHHGWTAVRSTPGKGSTFSYTIPVERATADPKLISGARPVLRSYASSTLLDSPTKIRSLFPKMEAVQEDSPTAVGLNRPLHVLVVEDNSINQKVLKRQLESRKCRVTIASDGQEALDILQAAPGAPEDALWIDVTLMDIEMPRMSGLEAIKVLREREKTGDISRKHAVIAVTGNARQEQISLYLQSGFEDVAIKPYNIDSVMRQIEQLVGRPAVVEPSSNGGTATNEEDEGDVSMRGVEELQS